MTPGPEMDALVAEKVMGCNVVVEAGPGFSAPHCGCLGETSRHGPHADQTRQTSMLPFYSTDIAAAWLVVERLLDEHVALIEISGAFESWDVQFRFGNSDRAHVPVDDAVTLPEAICRAALKAVGVEV